MPANIEIRPHTDKKAEIKVMVTPRRLFAFGSTPIRVLPSDSKPLTLETAKKLARKSASGNTKAEILVPATN